nr:hypothetical protein [Tanacetum cinerariifolium]
RRALILQTIAEFSATTIHPPIVIPTQSESLPEPMTTLEIGDIGTEDMMDDEIEEEVETVEDIGNTVEVERGTEQLGDIEMTEEQPTV